MYNKSSDEELSKQPYQNGQVDKNNGGSVRLYQPRNMNPNHDSMYHGNKMKNKPLINTTTRFK